MMIIILMTFNRLLRKKKVRNLIKLNWTATSYKLNYYKNKIATFLMDGMITMMNLTAKKLMNKTMKN